MRADQLEAWELEKLRNSTQQGMYSKEAQFRRRQTNELLALQKRIQAGRDEQKKLRQRDLECLLQRYQNVKSELETAQNLERILLPLVQNLERSRRNENRLRGCRVGGIAVAWDESWYRLIYVHHIHF